MRHKNKERWRTKKQKNIRTTDAERRNKNFMEAKPKKTGGETRMQEEGERVRLPLTHPVPPWWAPTRRPARPPLRPSRSGPPPPRCSSAAPQEDSSAAHSKRNWAAESRGPSDSALSIAIHRRRSLRAARASHRDLGPRPHHSTATTGWWSFCQRNWSRLCHCCYPTYQRPKRRRRMSPLLSSCWPTAHRQR